MHKPERATRKPKTNSLIMEKSEVDKMIDIFWYGKPGLGIFEEL